MRIHCSIALLACITLASAATLQFSIVDEKVANSQWLQFKNAFKKNYLTAAQERIRRVVWEENMKKIQKHNYEADLGKHTYRLGVNEYADLTSAEYKQLLLGYRRTATRRSTGSTFLAPSNVKLPAEMDWRKKGYVTNVKNQGQCGSCWAFSTTGSLEGQHFKKTGKLVSLSEQQLVDCSGKFGNEGCNGGLMDNAFKYIKANGGIDTERSYPYLARGMRCHFKKRDVGAEDTGFVDVKAKDEKALQQASATVGPISVAIDASHSSFQLYQSGVYNEEECDQDSLDHGVLVVGYGTHMGKDYWLVKNSWGSSWGMEGYIMMSRNKDNQCGIASQASYPLV